jgi:NAD(P)H-hydrate epimerase
MSSIPTVTAEQMREVDRLAVEGFGLLLIQMMENAGIRLAELVLRKFQPGTVAVLCGRGGNGGGGLVAARHLANRGVRVAVTLGADPDHLGDLEASALDPRADGGIDRNRTERLGSHPRRADRLLPAG